MICDLLGQEVPHAGEVRDLFADVQLARHALLAIATECRLLQRVSATRRSRWLRGLELALPAVAERIDELVAGLPWMLCHGCQGNPRRVRSCAMCNGHGWFGREEWRLVQAEIAARQRLADGRPLRAAKRLKKLLSQESKRERTG